MSHTLVDVLGSLVALAVGFAIGQIVAWRRAKIGGREFLVPTAHPGPRTAKIAAALVILVATASMLSGVATQARIERCNERYREIVQIRSDGSAEQFQAITDLQVRLARAEAGIGGAEERYQARQDYVERVQEIEAFRASHPYPTTEC